MRAIQKELGEDDRRKADAAQLRERLETADFTDEVRKEAERVEAWAAAAAGPGLSRHSHLSRIRSELPWRKASEEKLDLNEARKVLDETTTALKISGRILESLAVVKLRPDSKSPILLSSVLRSV
jgi:ATP-dependent Lon protease